MSNTVHLSPCKFVDFDFDGNEIGAQYGFRLYDYYGSLYVNDYTSIEEVLDACSPQHVLQTLYDLDSEWYQTIRMRYPNPGLYICDIWFDTYDLNTDIEKHG